MRNTDIRITRRFVVGPGYHIVDTHLDKDGVGGVVHLDGNMDSAIDACRAMNAAYEAMHPLRTLVLADRDGRVLGYRACPHGFRGRYHVSVANYGTLVYLLVVEGSPPSGKVVRECRTYGWAVSIGDEMEVWIDGWL